MHVTASVRPRSAVPVPVRTLTIGLTAFLTVADLFATQAILPALTRAYATTPAAMSFAVNASTIGMAVSSLLTAIFGQRVERKIGVMLSLIGLTAPTVLLGTMPPLVWFTLLRITQGVFMAAAFTLTLAHLAEAVDAREAPSAFAAYTTGNVASNLFGRLISAGVADHFGLAWNFYAFAGLNLAGAALVGLTMRARAAGSAEPLPIDSMVAAWRYHLRDPALRAAFALGFCILFAFIGTFSYVNFVLVRPPLALSMMSVGLVYFVFLPSVMTTPFAGALAVRWGIRRTAAATLAVAMAGLPLLLLPSLPALLAGLVLVSIGTFAAQAMATGFVGRTARTGRAAASGLYLASYFLGGLFGGAALGLVFDRSGWPMCVAGIGVALLCGIGLSARLRPRG